MSNNKELAEAQKKRTIAYDPDTFEKDFDNRNKSLNQWAKLGMGPKKSKIFHNSDVTARKKHNGYGRSTYFSNFPPRFNPKTDKTLDDIFSTKQPSSKDDIKNNDDSEEKEESKEL